MTTSARRAWTEVELRTAIQRLVDAAYGRRTDAPAAFHIPAQPTDADLLLHDAIDELVERRAAHRAMETTGNVLRCLVCYYDGRARAAQRAMNDAPDFCVAAGHALSALHWGAKAETVRKVAENLAIALPDGREGEERKGGDDRDDRLPDCPGRIPRTRVDGV